MLRFKVFIALLVFVFSSFNAFALDENPEFKTENTKVRVENFLDCSVSDDGVEDCQKMMVRVLKGSLKGRVFNLDLSYLDFVQKSFYLDKGATFFATIEGFDEQNNPKIILGEVDRTFSLFLLLAIFLGLVIVIGGKQGAFSILALILNFFVLIYIIATGVLSGFNSLILVVFGGIILLSFSMFITYGFNKKSLSAFLSSVSGLFITIILTLIFLPLSKMTGFASEEASFLAGIFTNISMRDVLFVGICVGILGILDDVTVNQSSLTFQLVSVKPKLSKSQIFFKSLAVGKDHMASMVNTLIIAYAGASFPLFLLLIKDTNASLMSILNMEVISEEILRMLIGSIGIIVTIPISAYIATVFAKQVVKRKGEIKL
jgi:uncharacterized membrane protein